MSLEINYFFHVPLGMQQYLLMNSVLYMYAVHDIPVLYMCCVFTFTHTGMCTLNASRKGDKHVLWSSAACALTYS